MPKVYPSSQVQDNYPHHNRMADPHGNQQHTYYLSNQPNTLPTHQQPSLPPVPPLTAPEYSNYTPYATGTPAPVTYAGPSTSPTTPTTGALARGSPYPHGGSTSRVNPLHRGEACLTCRKRKMKCDAARPSCGPCSRQGKADDCEYEESRFLAQIARLEEEVTQLRARIRELEGTSDASSSSTSASAPAPASNPSTSASNSSNLPPGSPRVAEFDYAQTNAGAGPAGFTAYMPSQAQTQTSNVRRSPTDLGAAGRPRSAFGYNAPPGSDTAAYEHTRSGTNAGYEAQTYTPTHASQQQYARSQGHQTPSPPGLTPGTELGPEVFGRM